MKIAGFFTSVLSIDALGREEPLQELLRSLDKEQRELAATCFTCRPIDGVLEEAQINISKNLMLSPDGERLLRRNVFFNELQRNLNEQAAVDEMDGSIPFQNGFQYNRVPVGVSSLHAPSVPFPVDDAAAEVATAALLEAGVVKLAPGTKPQRLCLESMKTIMEYVLMRDVSRMEGMIHGEHRHHLLLTPDMPAVADMLSSVLKGVRAVLEPILGDHNLMSELAAFLTNPGAAAQPFHTDIHIPNTTQVARSYSVFVFLTQVESAQDGALHVLPYSHFDSPVRQRVRAHHKWESAKVAKKWRVRVVHEFWSSKIKEYKNLQGQLGLASLLKVGLQGQVVMLLANGDWDVVFQGLHEWQRVVKEDLPKLEFVNAADAEGVDAGDMADHSDLGDLDIEGRPLKVACGDVVIYDSTLMHKGGQNFGVRTRGVLYFSFLGPGTRPTGTTYAIDNHLLYPPHGPHSMKGLEQAFLQTVGARSEL